MPVDSDRGEERRFDDDDGENSSLPATSQEDEELDVAVAEKVCLLFVYFDSVRRR